MNMSLVGIVCASLAIATTWCFTEIDIQPSSSYTLSPYPSPMVLSPETIFTIACYQKLFDKSFIKLSDGWIKGVVDYSRDGRLFYSFRGIPYAKPPVGSLRFRAPEPPTPWYGILDASRDAPKCMQKDYLFVSDPPAEGSEDCLYVNVYTPKIPMSKLQSLPVMVYIHHGGFFTGNSQSGYEGAGYFMDQNVVLVTFNYRLGVFGFLCTNDDAAPGNWAFKDQALLLKWVQENIQYFGGDKDRVTIFGQSAGAASVHYQILSPVTKGLFHAAIIESGSALAIWANTQNELQAQIAKQQALFVGCNSTADSQIMVECLRGIDARVLADSSDRFKVFSTDPIVIYMPVIEKQTSNNLNPFLIESPLTTILQGNFHPIPIIFGVVEYEGILRVAPLFRQSHIRSQFEKKIHEYAPLILGLGLSVPPNQVSDLWNTIYNSFLDRKFDVQDPEWVEKFVYLLGDRYFTYSTYQSALLHASKGRSPIWFYNFDYRGERSYGDLFALTSDDIAYDWGTSHCDELLYLFPSPKLFPHSQLQKSDLIISELMIQLWTHFATDGYPADFWQPLPDLSGKNNVKNSDLTYLNISGNYKEQSISIKMYKNFNTERMLRWRNLPLLENIPNID